MVSNGSYLITVIITIFTPKPVNDNIVYYAFLRGKSHYNDNYNVNCNYNYICVYTIR